MKIFNHINMCMCRKNKHYKSLQVIKQFLHIVTYSESFGNIMSADRFLYYTWSIHFYVILFLFMTVVLDLFLDGIIYNEVFPKRFLLYTLVYKIKKIFRFG